MLSMRSLAVALLLACVAPVAIAQTAKAVIEQQMTPEEFKAAGLDKLSADELAHLNTWLGRTLEVQTARTAADTKQQIEKADRGFFHFNSDEPIVSRISGDFRGFGKHKSYTLDNGQVWEQTDDALLPGIRLTNPEVRIKPGMVGNVWYMAVSHYNTRAQVKRVK
ncbi:MAG: hypothetical protein JWL98_29 [Xanthomonadaceae bacterium]|nr:hypothetical protein [Xanthomonadaceae bacterium]